MAKPTRIVAQARSAKNPPCLPHQSALSKSAHSSRILAPKYLKNMNKNIPFHGQWLENLHTKLYTKLQNTNPLDPARTYIFAAREAICEFDIYPDDLHLINKLQARHKTLQQHPTRLLPEEKHLPKINRKYNPNITYEQQLRKKLKHHINKSKARSLNKRLARHLLTETDGGTLYAAVIIYITYTGK